MARFRAFQARLGAWRAGAVWTHQPKPSRTESCAHVEHLELNVVGIAEDEDGVFDWIVCVCHP